MNDTELIDFLIKLQSIDELLKREKEHLLNQLATNHYMRNTTSELMNAILQQNQNRDIASLLQQRKQDIDKPTE